MLPGNAPTRLQFRLQRAGLSIPGATQLARGAPLTDPADRVILAALVGAQGPSAQHPPSLPPPAPPVPLPGAGPVLMGRAGPLQRARGAADSIWIDLGYPPASEVRHSLVRSGLSRQALEALLSARPLTDPRDRSRLAEWFNAAAEGAARGR